MTSDAPDDPASALCEIWEALDSLPRAVPSPAATATTLEMVAISAQHRSFIAARPAPLAWLAAVAIIAAGFLVGLAVGRASAPQRPLPPPSGRPFLDRERSFNERPRPFSDWERSQRRGSQPREETPTQQR